MADRPAVSRNVIIFAVIVVLAFLAYNFLTGPDRRNTTERIGDAIHDLPQGTDKASRQLDDRTPSQKLGDDVRDLREGR